MSRIQRVLATNQRNTRQPTILNLYPMDIFLQRPDGMLAPLEGRFNARFVRAFVDVDDIMGHYALVQHLLTEAPPKPVLFQPTPNVPAVDAVLILEDEAFDPETQTVRRRIYIKYGRSRNVPARVQHHRVTYGRTVFLFILPVPADMFMQCEGFLRDEFSMDEQRIPIILNEFERVEIVRVRADDLNEVLSVYYDLHEVLAIIG